MKNILFSFLTVLMLGNCSKSEIISFIEPPTEPQDSMMQDSIETFGFLKIKWKVPLYYDTSINNSTVPVLLDDDKVIFTVQPDFDKDPDNEIVTAYNRKTGIVEWSWVNPYGGHTNSTRSLYNLDNQLLYRAGGKDVILLDNAGNETWRIERGEDRVASGGSIIDKKNGHYFRGWNDRTSRPQDAMLLRYSLETGAFIDTILTAHKGETVYSPFLAPLGVYQNNKGEDMLYMYRSWANWDSIVQDHRLDLIEFNLNTYQIEYEWNDFLKEIDSEYSGPGEVVKDNKLFLPTRRYILCIDLITKEVVWKFRVRQYTAFRDLILAENVLFVNEDNDSQYGLNPETGEVIWERHENGAPNSKWVEEYNGIVYYGSLGDGRLYATDIKTGKHILRHTAPYRAFTNSPVVDPENNSLYIDDGVYIYCLELPK